MSDIATYTFLPWLRQGIANEITGQEGSRATIPIDVHIKGKKLDGSGDLTETVSRDVQVYGPGDITGLDNRAIIKTEPLHWITNFEPNYLPHIDFYDEDLPWRYTPLANPSSHRLQPWIALVVLKEDEFEDGKNIKDKPLPFIKLNDKAQLPETAQLALWAHVHINKDLIEDKFTETNTQGVEEKLENLLDQNPDMAYSRIVCPRRLKEKEAYHAFLVPTFESGRKAGLGEDSAGTGLEEAAWGKDSNAERLLPYYHRWYFRTGTVGDFEYLVRLLEPKPVDSRVGRRDIDVQDPGANLEGIKDDPAATEEQSLGGILKLGGALRVPDIFYSPEEFEEVEKYRDWATLNQTESYPHPFQTSLASFINLTDSYESEPALTVNENSTVEEKVPATDPDAEYDIKQNPDPLITAPLYGRWHAFTQRLLKARDNAADVSPNDNWVHELNLDPRWRVAAGFGTKVVQENQENYMKSAWDQVGDVLEANRKVRNAQLAKVASEVWYESWLKPVQNKYPGKWLNLASPVHKRVVSGGFTVFHQKKQSRLTTAVTSINMRKALRPRGKLVKRLPFNDLIKPDELLIRINDGEVSAAPPVETPEGIQTPQNLVEVAKPNDIPEPLSGLLEKYHWIKWAPLVIALLIILLLILFPFSAVFLSVGLAAIGGLLYVYRMLDRWSDRIQQANSILEENQTPESIDEMPSSPDFRISEPDEKFTPTLGGVDSDEAIRFKAALKDVNVVLQESARLGKVKQRPKLDIKRVNEDVLIKINPQKTIPDWVYSGIHLPPILKPFKEKFIEAMAYPRFDLPMYKPLAEYSAELFLPNINFVAQNSISILETNQKFIESYMVGLNHEFARELLWREYPTDQRGSYFRQFWDVAGFLDTQALQLNSLKARFKKIFDERNMPELKEYFDKLNDSTVTHDETFLKEAHQHILKEELKDIKPIHYWSKRAKLGDNDNREQAGDNEEEVVLVIRGELLKKYPTAVIYAHKAVWNYKRESEDEKSSFVLDENGNKIIDLTRERTLAPIPAGQEDNPPATIIKLPLYEAKVEPDIYFFGFDLTVCEAKGGTGEQDEAVDERCADDVSWDDAGWFFIIKERPGEPRFGLDIGDQKNINNSNEIELWNDLSWNDLTPEVEEGSFIQINGDTPTIKAIQALERDDEEKVDQQEEDNKVDWYENMNAAHLAYILYQVPVLVGVHASEMLSGIHTK